MLNKVCSKVSRYSRAPLSNIKTHQTQRPLNTFENQKSKLSQLTDACLAELRKVELNASLWTTMCALEDKYRADIHDEVAYEYQTLPDDRLISPDDSPPAKARALGFQLACGLAITPKFLMHYGVTTMGMTLEAAISSKHKTYLIETFNDTFTALQHSDQLAMAGVVQPEVLVRLGLPVSKEAMNFSTAKNNEGNPQLSMDQLLAMIDYCNSSSDMFNAVNESLRIWQVCGVDKLSSITSCLSTPLNQALNILIKHDAFFYRGPLYKGIAMYNAAGSFRLSKMQPGMKYTSPHWSSATLLESRNYSLTKQDRQLQLTICDAEGVRAHMFNDVSSIREGEVIMPPKPLYFLSQSEVEGDKLNPRRNHPTIYCTMMPKQSDTPVKPKEAHAVRV